jgi:mono/diheme cytochrome c family protein
MNIPATTLRAADATHKVEDFGMLVRWSRAFGIIVIAISGGGLLFVLESGFQASSLAPISLGVAASQSATAPTSVAAAIAPAQALASEETPLAVQAGAHLFREKCSQCHGAPGVTAVVVGLTPTPPNLLAAGRRNDPVEVFQKTTNGIAGTRMPAFRNIISDQGRRSLAAFLHHSRGISASAFDALSTAKDDTGQQGP